MVLLMSDRADAKMWISGLVLPLGLLVLAVEAFLTRSTLWLERGNVRGIRLGEVEGDRAVAAGIVAVGAAVAIFGWNFAHESLRLNPYYRVITGLGCLIAIPGALWAVYLQFSF